ncbi:MAG: sigma-54 dependent transcriptional regulator [Bacteroidetes bacterium]|nr:sigma-54 dependent transcriptional regulator [Bacteroidota bacterium]
MFGNILVVDDDPVILESIALLLKYESSQVDTLINPQQINDYLDKTSYELILLDMNFSPGKSSGSEGIYWLKKVLKSDPDAIVLMITAFADIKLAVEAMKQGATDFIQKPWTGEKLIATLKAAQQIKLSQQRIKSLEFSNRSLRENMSRFYPEIIGDSEPLKKLLKEIEKVAKTDANVLITGENGTGKELFARQLHLLSKRKNEIFLNIDLGAISDSLFESELFGHKKGSFTDAKENRVGRFEAANGGTLFLDEIGNLPISSQARLLHVVQNHEIIKIGTNRSTKIDVRFISATNKDLFELIEKGLFREDLLYRIRTVHIEVPALRDRGQDIIVLTNYFLNKYATKYEKDDLTINKQAYQKLLNYSWPGNVRELEHVIENAVVLSETKVLSNDDFPLRTHQNLSDEDLNLVEVEKKIILKALDKHKGNYTYAANELGISRTTLYLKLKRYDL